MLEVLSAVLNFLSQDKFFVRGCVYFYFFVILRGYFVKVRLEFNIETAVFSVTK